MFGFSNLGMGVVLALMLLLVGQTVRIEGVPIFGGGLKDRIVELDDAINNSKTGYVKRMDDVQTSLDSVIANRNALQDVIRTGNAKLVDAERRAREAEADAATNAHAALERSAPARHAIVQNPNSGPKEMNRWLRETLR